MYGCMCMYMCVCVCMYIYKIVCMYCNTRVRVLAQASVLAREHAFSQTHLPANEYMYIISKAAQPV